MILYLDFDGVLHDEDVVWIPGRGIQMRTLGRNLFEWEPILAELLAPHPEVRIVLSTSWVRVRSFNYAKHRLCPALQERVIGATFSKGAMDALAFGELPRGRQILADVARRQPANWFAVDDDSEGWGDHSGRLILTDERLGLSDPRVQDEIKERLERG